MTATAEKLTTLADNSNRKMLHFLRSFPFIEHILYLLISSNSFHLATLGSTEVTPQ